MKRVEVINIFGETVNFDFELENVRHECTKVTTEIKLFRPLLIPREIALLLTAFVFRCLSY